ncbi:Fcf1-domain-containing protein [Mrakia frigida]|uniref:rRNA-binding ribosome biosynthesis protein UTP23 n=1 Tax=Mrakia frigida TaxID=29902 RepID=UPI003FCC1F03
MRQKRAKAYKRLMHAYCVTFGFRQPYQVLLDAAFCESIARSGIDVEKQLETVLQGNCKPMITQCCISELYALGPSGQHVVDMAKNFERRKCNHREAIPGDECLTSVVGTTNPHRYIISTQSEPLRNHLRSNVPAVPVMHVKRGVTVMEPMSEVTKEKKESMETQSLAPPPSSIPAPPPPTASTSTDPTSKSTAPPPKKKPSGPKAPNPLSVKKKKVVAPPPTAGKGKGKESVKRKRDEEVEVTKKKAEEKKDEEDDGEGPLKVNIIGGDGEAGGEAGEGAGGRKKKRRRKRGKTVAGAGAAEEAEGEGSGEDSE